MYRIIIVVADTNDLDLVRCVTEENKSPEKFNAESLSRFKRILEVVKEGRHNWENGDYGDTPPAKMYEGELTEEDIDFFEEYLPYGEYGIHTIDSVKIYTIVSDETLL